MLVQPAMTGINFKTLFLSTLFFGLASQFSFASPGSIANERKAILIQNWIAAVLNPVIEESGSQTKPLIEISNDVDAPTLKITTPRRNYVIHFVSSVADEFPQQGRPELIVLPRRQIEGHVGVSWSSLQAIQGEILSPTGVSRLELVKKHSDLMRSLFRSDALLHPHIPHPGRTLRLSYTQQETFDQLVGFESERTNSGLWVGLNQPTGSGKTVVVAKYAEELKAHLKGLRIIVVVENRHILRRTIQTFQKILNIAESETLRIFDTSEKESAEERSAALDQRERQSSARDINSNTKLVAITRSSFMSQRQEAYSRIFGNRHVPLFLFFDEAHHLGREGGQFEVITSELVKRFTRSDTAVLASATWWYDDINLVRKYTGGKIATMFATNEQQEDIKSGEGIESLSQALQFESMKSGYASPLWAVDISTHIGDVSIRKILQDSVRRDTDTGKLEVTVHAELLKKISDRTRATRFTGIPDRVLIYVSKTAEADAYAPHFEALLGGKVKVLHSGETSSGSSAISWLNEMNLDEPNDHRYLIVVGMLKEGGDIPQVNGIVLLNNMDTTHSGGLRMLNQIIGRGARVAEDKIGFRLIDGTGASAPLLFNLGEILAVNRGRSNEMQGSNGSRRTQVSQVQVTIDNRTISADSLASEYQNLLGEALSMMDRASDLPINYRVFHSQGFVALVEEFQRRGLHLTGGQSAKRFFLELLDYTRGSKLEPVARQWINRQDWSGVQLLRAAGAYDRKVMRLVFETFYRIAEAAAQKGATTGDAGKVPLNLIHTNFGVKQILLRIDPKVALGPILSQSQIQQFRSNGSLEHFLNVVTHYGRPHDVSIHRVLRNWENSLPGVIRQDVRNLLNLIDWPPSTQIDELSISGDLVRSLIHAVYVVVNSLKEIGMRDVLDFSSASLLQPEKIKNLFELLELGYWEAVHEQQELPSIQEFVQSVEASLSASGEPAAQIPARIGHRRSRGPYITAAAFQYFRRTAISYSISPEDFDLGLGIKEWFLFLGTSLNRSDIRQRFERYINKIQWEAGDGAEIAKTQSGEAAFRLRLALLYLLRSIRQDQSDGSRSGSRSTSSPAVFMLQSSALPLTSEQIHRLLSRMQLTTEVHPPQDFQENQGSTSNISIVTDAEPAVMPAIAQQAVAPEPVAQVPRRALTQAMRDEFADPVRGSRKILLACANKYKINLDHKKALQRFVEKIAMGLAEPQLSLAMREIQKLSVNGLGWQENDGRNFSHATNQNLDGAFFRFFDAIEIIGRYNNEIPHRVTVAISDLHTLSGIQAMFSNLHVDKKESSIQAEAVQLSLRRHAAPGGPQAVVNDFRRNGDLVRELESHGLKYLPELFPFQLQMYQWNPFDANANAKFPLLEDFHEPSMEEFFNVYGKFFATSLAPFEAAYGIDKQDQLLGFLYSHRYLIHQVLNPLLLEFGRMDLLKIYNGIPSEGRSVNEHLRILNFIQSEPTQEIRDYIEGSTTPWDSVSLDRVRLGTVRDLDEMLVAISSELMPSRSPSVVHALEALATLFPHKENAAMLAELLRKFGLDQTLRFTGSEVKYQEMNLKKVLFFLRMLALAWNINQFEAVFDLEQFPRAEPLSKMLELTKFYREFPLQLEVLNEHHKRASLDHLGIDSSMYYGEANLRNSWYLGESILYYVGRLYAVLPGRAVNAPLTALNFLSALLPSQQYIYLKAKIVKDSAKNIESIDFLQVPFSASDLETLDFARDVRKKKAAYAFMRMIGEMDVISNGETNAPNVAKIANLTLFRAIIKYMYFRNMLPLVVDGRVSKKYSEAYLNSIIGPSTVYPSSIPVTCEEALSKGLKI